MGFAQLHTPAMFDWNDLKYLLAVARHQSTIVASRALAVNQSTVQRRIVELERRIRHSWCNATRPGTA